MTFAKSARHPKVWLTSQNTRHTSADPTTTYHGGNSPAVPIAAKNITANPKYLYRQMQTLVYKYIRPPEPTIRMRQTAGNFARHSHKYNS